MSERSERARLERDREPAFRHSRSEFRNVGGVNELAVIGDAILKSGGRDPASRAGALSRADSTTQARAVIRLQQTRGNAYVQRVMGTTRNASLGNEDLALAIEATSESGSGLDDGARRHLERSLAVDLGQVRVHTGGEADALSRAVEAVAFTSGQDIFFRAGAYDPHSVEGLSLLAHEVVHTVQQASGPVSGNPAPGGVSISDPSDSFEQAADRDSATVINSLVGQSSGIRQKGSAALSGNNVGSASGQSPFMALQRQEEETQWKSIADNPIWNTITHNAVSGGVSLIENMSPGYTLPTLTTTLSRLGGFKGLEAGVNIEKLSAAPAAAAPGVLGPSAKLGGVSPLGAALAPLGAVSNAISFKDAIERPGSWLDKGGDAAASALGFFSSAVTTTGLAGAGLTALGAEGAGGALTAATGSAGLGPAGAVAGAGAGGYALGRLLDQGVGWGMEKIMGPGKGDYSISGMIGKGLYSADETMANLIDSDPNKPAYKKTLAWKLANWLD